MTIVKEYQTSLTLKSSNVKVGKIPVSTTTFKTCPNACPLKSQGCYAESGHLAMFWRKVTELKAGTTYQAFIQKIKELPVGTFWRHNQAGDLAGDQVTIDSKALKELIKANKGKKGFTYTHYDVIKNLINRKLVKESNLKGFTVNLSANNLEHADQLKALNIAPVATILDHTVNGKETKSVFTPKGNRVIVCPATYLDKVTCDSCRLCQISKRDFIIGFPAHGARKVKASTIAKGE
jgi:hypothetical protein